MESRKRTIAKALSWQALGLAVMAALSYWRTGSMSDALVLAAASSVSGLTLYVLHERLWNSVDWGRSVTGPRGDENRSSHRNVLTPGAAPWKPRR